MTSKIGKPVISDDTNEPGDYITKPVADALYMNTNEPYTADLDMTGHKIVNLGEPANDSDAVSKKYVNDNFSLNNYARRDELASLATKTELQNFVTKNDLADNDKADQRYVNTRVNTRLPLSGGTMAGNINMSNKKIVGIAHPTMDLDVTNKIYVDNSVETRLGIAGGTMTGALNMGGNKVTNIANPTSDLDAVNKKYVNDNFSLTNYARRDELTTLATKTELQNFITKNDLADNDRADQRYVNTKVNTRLPLSGGTMAGNINMNNKKIIGIAHPEEDLEVTNKIYVDNSVETRLSTAGGRLGGALDMTRNKVTNVANPTSDSDAANKVYVDSGIATKLNTSGGTLSGALDMGGSKVTNIADPTDDSDAVSKVYVDNSVGGKLNTAGGTMTGAVNMGANKITNVAPPTSEKDCTTKEYVDMALRTEIPFMHVYKLPFVGSDNRNASYNITIANLVDEAFRGKAPHHIMISAVIGMVPQANVVVDLVASVRVVSISGNTMSVRIQTDNKRGGSWTTAFDVYLQVIVIPPRRLATSENDMDEFLYDLSRIRLIPAFRSLAGGEGGTSNDDEAPAPTVQNDTPPANARNNIIDSSASYI
jgi:hypothetical protein